jgi:cell division protein FtsA
MFNIRQIGLENRLHGGIILTGGGARLKHITQLTEYVTGMGARIGYPNEHLAGGYNDALMSPMYSTCIGLILRGYHDFESGKLDFSGSASGNYLRLSPDAPVVEQPAVTDTIEEEDTEDNTNNRWDKFRKRQDTMKELFDRLRGKFMDLFEDIDDTELK